MIVFFDIDGTIIDNETQVIPQSAVRAVERLCENGHIPVVNTGRPYSHIDPRVRQMAFRGWVCGCGMEILLNGSHVYRVSPDAALRQFVTENVRRFGVEGMYETDDGCILFDGEPVNPSNRAEAARMTKKGFSVLSLREHPEFMKLVTFDLPGCDREGFAKAVEEKFEVIRRENDMLELVMKGNSKAMGMQRLMDQLGISREEAVAIGDSTNDVPMFSVARHTVCMGGGMEELKGIAEYVTAPVLEDGIEKALSHFGLL